MERNVLKPYFLIQYDTSFAGYEARIAKLAGLREYTELHRYYRQTVGEAKRRADLRLFRFALVIRDAEIRVRERMAWNAS